MLVNGREATAGLIEARAGLCAAGHGGDGRWDVDGIGGVAFRVAVPVDCVAGCTQNSSFIAVTLAKETQGIHWATEQLGEKR